MGIYTNLISKLLTNKNVSKLVSKVKSNKKMLINMMGVASCAFGYFCMKKSDKELEEQVVLQQKLNDVRGQLKRLQPCVEDENSLEVCSELKTEDEKIYYKKF